MSRYSPVNWMPGSASLLVAIRDAQFRSVLESRAVATDKTPVRAREDADRPMHARRLPTRNGAQPIRRIGAAALTAFSAKSEKN